jgi:hypothetical protein
MLQGDFFGKSQGVRYDCKEFGAKGPCYGPFALRKAQREKLSMSCINKERE